MAWIDAMKRGQEAFSKGEFAVAVQYFEAATEVESGRVEAWVNWGVALVELTEYKRAKVALEQAIKLTPNMMFAHLALGDVFRMTGKSGEAEESYRYAVNIQPTPMGVNKLACLLRSRGKPQQAEPLYQQIVQMAPDFTLAKVNLATLQVELERFDEASKQLEQVAKLHLSPIEQAEVHSTQQALVTYQRVQSAVDIATTKHDLKPLEKAVRSAPAQSLLVDKEIYAELERYADSARKLATQEEEGAEGAIQLSDLPSDWPLIEGLFMIPYVETVDAYLDVKKGLESELSPQGDLLESVNMKNVVEAMREIDFDSLSDPIKGEVNLRYWHALATMHVKDMQPGQFKITKNLTQSDISKIRAEPHLVSGTFRKFFTEIYSNIPAGLYRGLLTMLAISDVHAFSDGNGRLGISWLNRELEQAKQHPIVLNRELGIRGKLSLAMREVRRNGGDLSPMVEVVKGAQQFTKEFCEELKRVQ